MCDDIHHVYFICQIKLVHIGNISVPSVDQSCLVKLITIDLVKLNSFVDVFKLQGLYLCDTNG